ncbi:Protein IDA-LIKE 2, partial [Cucurbita argyrosperma subsp. argyrosperma]
MIVFVGGGRTRKLAWMLLVMLLMNGELLICCNGYPTKHALFFKLKPKKPHSYGHFFGFLPRRIPIPASGPSRKHNDIGLRSWRAP